LTHYQILSDCYLCHEDTLICLYIKVLYCFFYSLKVELDKKKLELKINNTTLLASPSASNKKHIYYLTFAQADTTVFDKDILILSSTRLNKEFSRLELNADSTFCYYYDIQYTTKRTSDAIKNEATAAVVEKSDKVVGKWYTSDIDKSLQLTFKDKRTIDYSISNDNDRLYLKRR
jgi:hypothetical protein